MRILLDKSVENLDSAKELASLDFFNSSVHCCYYSNIQLMLHILYNNLGIDENEFAKSKEIRNKGSHNRIFSLIKPHLIKSKNVDLTIFRKFNDLKSFRSVADYQQKKIIKSDCSRAYYITLELNSFIKSVFKI